MSMNRPVDRMLPIEIRQRQHLRRRLRPRCALSLFDRVSVHSLVAILPHKLHCMRAGLTRAALLICLLTAFVPLVDAAQAVRGAVFDQTGLPLPGVIIQLLDGDAVIQSQLTDENGSFAIDASQAGDVVSASLEGFEPLRVARADASRIVLVIAHTSETTTVLAPGSVESSPTAALLEAHSPPRRSRACPRHTCTPGTRCRFFHPSFAAPTASCSWAARVGTRRLSRSTDST